MEIHRKNNYEVHKTKSLKRLNSIKNSNINMKTIKPSILKLIKNLLSNSSILFSVFNYLTLNEVNLLRQLNHYLLKIVQEYFKLKIKAYIKEIVIFQNKNKNIIKIYIRKIDQQIPITNKNWLDLDMKSVTNKLQILDINLLNRVKYKNKKNSEKLSDYLYAPFCIIMGYNQKNMPLLLWKEIFSQILDDKTIIYKIKHLDIENLNDNEIMEIFVCLNMTELDINNITNYSIDFAKLIVWCQAVVSYHILIHPFILRNKKPFEYLNNFIEIKNIINELENKIEYFYRFKRYLYIINVIKIPLADYVFNFHYERLDNIEEEKKINNKNFFANIDINLLSNILTYIPYIDKFNIIRVSKQFYESYKKSIDLSILQIILKIYFFKYKNYNSYINKKAFNKIYEYNIFSNYFLMIDDIMNSEIYINNILSKEFWNDLKIIKSSNKNIIKISKIFCIIFDINNKNNYYIDNIKSFAYKKNVNTILRSLNLNKFTEKKIMKICQEIKLFFNIQALNEIKNINKIYYKLLIWEIYIMLYLKPFNIYDFNLEKIKEQKEIDNIKYYISLINKLKYFLSIKKNNSHLIKYKKKLITFLTKNNVISNSRNILRSSNDIYEKIGNAYFESKNMIPLNIIESYYERIIIEILNTNQNNKQNVDININIIPEKILIKYLLFYLDIKTIFIISLLNKNFLSITRTHLFLRIYYLNKKIENIININKDTVKNIILKRQKYFKDYEINFPSKEHSFYLMNQLTINDLLELKKYFQIYNSNYFAIVTPFLYLILGVNKKFDFNFAKKFFYNDDFLKKIQNFEVEFISYESFKKVEQLMSNKIFLEENIKNLSPCFINIVKWILGAMEYHRFFKKFAINEYDYKLLDKKERDICKEINREEEVYYGILRYLTKYCKDYENKAKNYLNE